MKEHDYSNNVDISIVIVNYNVQDFLFQAVESIYKSETKLIYEIIIVDNNSSDNSVNLIKEKFPNVILVESDKNLGFSKANNLGFNLAKGKYLLILNPDTVISNDTLQIMYDYLECTPEVGVAGCKVLNHDGSFQLACRRGSPSPWAAFCKLFGLQSLFPNLKLFSGYNLTYLDENKSYYIDALIGAFMFARKEVIDKIGGFDEDYFMYGEDLDLCYQIKKIGYKVAYYPKTTIIHFKGESAKRSDINEIKHFYEAMQIYSRKNLNTSLLFLFFLKIGIKFRELITLIKNNKNYFYYIIIDLIIINTSLLVATYLRKGSFLAFPPYAYPIVFIFLSLINFLSMFLSGEYFESRPTVRKSFVGLLSTFFVLTVLTYFFRDFAFSRGILILTIGIAGILLIISRMIIAKLINKKPYKYKTIVFLNGVFDIKNIEKLQNDKNTEIIGFVGSYNPKFSSIKYLGDDAYLPKLIQEYNVNEVVQFSKNNLNLSAVNIFKNKNNEIVSFNSVSSIEDLKTERLIHNISDKPDIKKYKLSLPRYKLVKRLIDIIFGVFAIPFVLFASNIKRKNIIYLLKGNISLIGCHKINDLPESGKIGIIGMADLEETENISEDSIKKLNQFYVSNYSISLDLDILLNYITRKLKWQQM